MYTAAPFQGTRRNLQRLLNHALEQLPFSHQSVWLLRDFKAVSGGDTSQSYLLYTDGPCFFLKVNSSAKLPLFRAELYCLKEIIKTQSIKACRPFGCGHLGEYAYLLLEGLELCDQGDWSLAGRQIAQLHQADVGTRYGFAHETFCGKSAQVNDWEDNWGHFFAVKRIGQQLMRFHRCSIRAPEVIRVIDWTRTLLSDHQPTPSLLHGDLWHGNIRFTGDQPTTFDPASYYGDRETDIAMSELFGRLPEAFYQGYEHAYPLSVSYVERRPIYQLYHLINHANLFGGSYRQQAEDALDQLMRGCPVNV